MSLSPNANEAGTKKVPDGEAAKKLVEDFWNYFTVVGGNRVKTLLQSKSGPEPEIPSEEECLEAFDKMAAKHISETAEMLRKQLDNVLLFATLFSAINSAFLIYTLPTATTGVQDPTNQLLLYVIRGLNNESAEDATNFLAAAESSGRTVDIIVNATFSISFVLSIIGTLIAVLGQTWVTNYGRDMAAQPTELRDERGRKLTGADRWYFQPVLEIVLPIILQAALIVFCGGFIVLLWSINTTLAIAVLPFLALGFLAIGASVGFALWDTGCPYQTPISSRILPMLLSGAYRLWYYVAAILVILTKRLVYPAFCFFELCCSGRRDRRDWRDWRAGMEKTTQGYNEYRQALAAKLRRAVDSPGVRHADLVAWSFSHSTDPIAAGRVVSTLLHGGTQYTFGISDDVYHHPVFEQLLSAAWKHIKNTETNSQEPLWNASYRAIWHIFLATSTAPSRDALAQGHTKSLLQLEAAAGTLWNYRNESRTRGNGGRFAEILEVAACFKLLGLLASRVPETGSQIQTWSQIPSSLGRLIQTLEHAVDSSLSNESLAFYTVYYIGEIISILMAEEEHSVSPDTRDWHWQLRHQLVDLYDGLQYSKHIWDEDSSFELRQTHCIPVGSMMRMAKASVASGSGILPAILGRFFEAILYHFSRPELQGKVLRSDFIYAQLAELKLLLEVLPKGKVWMKLRSFKLSEGFGSPDFWDIDCFDNEVDVPQIRERTLFLAKKLVQAGTSRPISKDNHWCATQSVDVGHHLLKMIDFVPEKDQALSTALDYLGSFLIGSSFSSLDWGSPGSSGESIQSMFGLCRAMTELGKRARGRQEFDSKSLEELSLRATVINLKTLEIISEKWTAPIVWSEYSPTTDEYRHRAVPCNIARHLADYLREAEIKRLTERQWNGLVHIETSLESVKSRYRFALHPYALPSEGTVYLERMKIARSEREKLTAAVEDGHALPSDLQDATIGEQPGGAPESESSANPFGWRMKPVGGEGEMRLQEAGGEEEQMKQESEIPLRVVGVFEGPLDSPK